MQGKNIRLGEGAASVVASHTGATYTTTIDVRRVGLRALRIGHTLPHGAKVAKVKLDGRTITKYTARETNRGVEVTAAARPASGPHTLVVTAGEPVPGAAARSVSRAGGAFTSVWAVPDVPLEQLDADPHPVLARLRASEPVASCPRSAAGSSRGATSRWR